MDSASSTTYTVARSRTCQTCNGVGEWTAPRDAGLPPALVEELGEFIGVP